MEEGIFSPGIANLDIELQCSPTLHNHGILVLWYAKCRTEGASENAGDWRLGGLSLVRMLGLPGTE